MQKPKCKMLLFGGVQEVEQNACRELRHVFVSGEALPPTSVAKFIKVLPHAQLHNLYGPTEATVDVTGAFPLLEKPFFWCREFFHLQSVAGCSSGM